MSQAAVPALVGGLDVATEARVVHLSIARQGTSFTGKPYGFTSFVEQDECCLAVDCKVRAR